MVLHLKETPVTFLTLIFIGTEWTETEIKWTMESMSLNTLLSQGQTLPAAVER
jgi:hypothetical protein